VGKILYGINTVTALALFFAYLSPYIKPTTTWIFSFFGLGYSFLLIANVSFFFFWLAFKPKYAWLSGLCVLCGLGVAQKYVGFNSAKTSPSAFDIMSYNIGKTRVDFHYKNKQKKIDRFQRFIAKEQPDIVCIQERLPRHLDYYKQIFKGYTLHPESDIGTAIYTKYPIVNAGNIPFNTKSHNATWADINIKDKIFRIYSLHLSSNRVPNLSDNVKEIWDESKYIIDKYHEHAITRVGQLEKVLAHAAKSPYPVIINGDFNDVPQSYIYKLVGDKYQDAFLERGQGLGQTFNSRFIGLRIDYSFASDQVDILDHDIIQSPISDHYPIVTTIGVDPKTP